MLRRREGRSIGLLILCILIQNDCGNATTEWNEECYSNNVCYKLLEGGRKFAWAEAYDLCRKEKGYLLNETWIAMIEKAETFKIQKELVYDDDIWTSLRLINGYIQEVSRHTNYAQSSNELWKTYPVWNKDMCVKLTRQTKLEAVECSTNLSVICTSDFEEINQPSVSDCDERLNPALTAKVSGRYINVRDGHLEISEEDEGNVIFVCGGLEGRSEIAWIKDGVYLNARNQTFEPSATVDPSTTSVHLYSMQGTYWCEENSPGCSRVYSSNKVNLIFERIITIHVTLEQNKNYVSFENEIAAEVDKFRSCDTKGKIGYDVRRRFTVNGSSAIATNDVNFYVPNDTVSTNLTRAPVLLRAGINQSEEE